ncbi:hypothetical protein RclHR1_01930020 [Rhizophagus clarus]|uniref:Checkpoint protein n=1 Tax=Rhizophagus clarus TaxID=94130 RepID=A0A2Z6RHB2_9GLOM|nr:hypothetical protein RclHR1_01930020 [Rhizophagus clarus]GES87081.1 hypothetical protein GLOIN_2v1687324 [Rhizophagus clarus]
MRSQFRESMERKCSLRIDFKSVAAFRLMTSYMRFFAEENVRMVINEKEIKLLYEEPNRGRIFTTLNDNKEINNIKVINESLHNHLILKFKLNSLEQALEEMYNKSNVKMELRQQADDTKILFFESSENSASKFKVEIIFDNCYRLSTPPLIFRKAIKLEFSDLHKLFKMAKLFSKVKDNLYVSVQHTASHHIFKIKYSLDTGSKMCHQIKYSRESQVDMRSSDVTTIKSQLFSIFFKLPRILNITCFVKQQDYILLEAQNDEYENIRIKAHLKGLSEA